MIASTPGLRRPARPPGSGRVWDNRSGRAGIRYPGPDRAPRKGPRSGRSAPRWSPRSASHRDSGFGLKVFNSCGCQGPPCGRQSPPRRNSAYRPRSACPARCARPLGPGSEAISALFTRPARRPSAPRKSPGPSACPAAPGPGPSAAPEWARCRRWKQARDRRSRL